MVQREASISAAVTESDPQRSGPVRTCIGCRQRAVTVDLLRVVARPSDTGSEPGFDVVPDTRHRLDGRGAWLHPSSECLDQALRRRAFGRALRVTGPVTADGLIAHLRGAEPDDWTA